MTSCLLVMRPRAFVVATLPSPVCIWCQQIPKMKLNLLWNGWDLVTNASKCFTGGQNVSLKCSCLANWWKRNLHCSRSRLRNVDTQEQPLRMHSFVWVFVSNLRTMVSPPSFCFSKIREILWKFTNLAGSWRASWVLRRLQALSSRFEKARREPG